MIPILGGQSRSGRSLVETPLIQLGLALIAAIAGVLWICGIRMKR